MPCWHDTHLASLRHFLSSQFPHLFGLPPVQSTLVKNHPCPSPVATHLSVLLPARSALTVPAHLDPLDASVKG